MLFIMRDEQLVIKNLGFRRLVGEKSIGIQKENIMIVLKWN